MSKISPLAYIDKDAQIGENCEIGPFCFIDKNVVIGDNNVLMNNVSIHYGARIGNGNTFFPGAVISGIPQDLKFHGEDTIAQIGDNNIFRENVTVNRGTASKGKTIVGNDNVLMEGAHISHDTIVGNRCVFGYGTKIAGDCVIEDGVIFSSSVIENAKTRVGEGAMIQAGTTFSKDVPPYIICTKRSEYGGVNYTMGKFYGVDEKTLKHIANAYRLVFMGQTSVFDAVMQIEQQVPDGPQIRHIIEFIRATKLGIISKM